MYITPFFMFKMHNILSCVLRAYVIINEKKTNLMVVNGDERDKQPINVNTLSVKHCDLYIYLGSPFTSDGLA